MKTILFACVLLLPFAAVNAAPPEFSRTMDLLDGTVTFTEAQNWYSAWVDVSEFSAVSWWVHGPDSVTCQPQWAFELDGEAIASVYPITHYTNWVYQIAVVAPFWRVRCNFGAGVTLEDVRLFLRRQ